MPTWMTHFTDGATGTSQNLTGTPTNTGTSEVQNFNIIIRDSENQSHNRDFSLTVVDFPAGGESSFSGVSYPNTYTSGGVTYRVHVFTASGTTSSTSNFEVNADLVCDFLIVGGGGASTHAEGYSGSCGGAGAGGMVVGTSQTILASSSPYSITVGGGGAKGTSVSSMGGNGSNSSAFGYTAIGGGGSPDYGSDGASGGSGAGGSEPSRSAGSSTQDTYSGVTNVTGYGNAGGAGHSYPSGGSGGGGGANGAGQGATSGRAGGAGKTNAFRTGSDETYAKGGDGKDGDFSPSAPTAHTGNGSDGVSTNSGDNGGSQDGASGIVIIRYAI